MQSTGVWIFGVGWCRWDCLSDVSPCWGCCCVCLRETATAAFLFCSADSPCWNCDCLVLIDSFLFLPVTLFCSRSIAKAVSGRRRTIPHWGTSKMTKNPAKPRTIRININSEHEDIACYVLIRPRRSYKLGSK